MGSTMVAVGIDSPDPRTGGSFEAGPTSGRDVNASVWISDGGRTWTKVRSDVLGGVDWQDMFDIVELDGTAFAVGVTTEGSSGGWRSPIVGRRLRPNRLISGSPARGPGSRVSRVYPDRGGSRPTILAGLAHIQHR